MSNVRLTLLRDIPPVDTADVGKNMNILCQRGKWDIFRILKARFSLCSALPLLRSHSLTLQRSPFLRLPSFVLVLSLLLSNSPFSWSHCRSQPLRSRALTLALFTVSLSSEKVSLRCEGLRTLRLSKRLVFYFVYVWKACKGCCFKGLLMQKDVFFCLWNDLRVKFWFLFGFWWKMKSFWSFNCSVLDLKRFLHLGFDFCLLLK